MTEPSAPPIGSVGWVDLTVPDAPRLRDFYGAVVGWTPSEIDMGGYADYSMMRADGEPAAGVCHARGVNAGLPPVWLVYFSVQDLDASLAEVGARGGTVVQAAKDMGAYGRYAVICDPAGAVCALIAAKR
jgi:predicted enzyme related to lactoylglutathione lyase